MNRSFQVDKEISKDHDIVFLLQKEGRMRCLSCLLLPRWKLSLDGLMFLSEMMQLES